MERSIKKTQDVEEYRERKMESSIERTQYGEEYRENTRWRGV